MYLFAALVSIVCVVYGTILHVANGNIVSGTLAQADYIERGLLSYDYAYGRFMAQYGSVNNERYPGANSDLFPVYGFSPTAPYGGSWTFGQASSAGRVQPYVCFTGPVNSLAYLEAVKQKAYANGASVIQGSNCTATVQAVGNLQNSVLPATVSVVKYYTGKSVVTQGVN